MKKVLCWIFGIIFALVAVSSLSKLHYVSFLFEAIIALLLVPLTNKYMKEKYLINIPTWATPTTISLYLIFLLIIGIIYLDPFMKQAIKRAREEISYSIIGPLPRITAEQKEIFESFEIDAYNLSSKIVNLKTIKSQKLKEKKCIEYSKNIKNLKVSKKLPLEVQVLLIESILDLSTALEMTNTNKYSPLDVVSKTLDAQSKIKEANILLGISPNKNAYQR